MCFHTLFVLPQEHKFWEESFKVYERGLSLFKWPHVRDLWQTYLSHFVQRYKGTKLERARDLFRQAIDSVSNATSRVSCGVSCNQDLVRVSKVVFRGCSALQGHQAGAGKGPLRTSHRLGKQGYT